MSHKPDEFRDWDAAYVLGALSPEDRLAYLAHLSTCTACTAAVTELAGMPGLLRNLSAGEAEALMTVPDDSHLFNRQHQPGLVQRLATAANKRRRRLRAGALALAVVTATGVVLGSMLIGASLTPSSNAAQGPFTSTPSGKALTMSPVQPGNVTATLLVSSKPWGTRLDWTCEYPDGGASNGEKAYSMVMIDTSGAETVIATWNAAQQPRAKELAASTSLATSKIRRIEIRASATNTPLAETNL